MAVAPTYVGNAVNGLKGEVPGATQFFACTGTVGGSDTYVTNGFAIAPSAVGVTSINWMGPVTFSTGHWGVYVPASGLIKVFTAGSGAAAPAELGNGSTALQGATFLVFGTGK